MNIPLMDLRAQHDSLEKEINEVIREVISEAAFIGGRHLNEFEEAFAKFCGSEFCVGIDSGTAALYVVLKNLGIGAGDEVIMPVNTFIATPNAVRMCGAKPVFVDVSERDYLIDTSLIEDKINANTKAIIPVHLYGGVCDMEKMKELSDKYGLKIIEDCAQAHGSEFMGKRVPILGIGCFSFFPAKNLGAYGDGGAIVCDDPELVKKCRMFINHGRTEKYLHETEGFNFRMDNLQAAILNVKLKKLEEWIKKKNEIAEIYSHKLKGKFRLQENREGDKNSYHLFVIRSDKRDGLGKFLEASSISSGIHYPVPLHLQPTFRYLEYEEGDFPIGEMLSKEILSIPIYPELEMEKAEFISSKVLEFE